MRSGIMNSWVLLKAVISLPFLLAVVSCHKNAVPEKSQHATVFTQLAKSVEIFDLIHYPARVNAKVNATILSENDGIITKLNTTLGQKVNQRQILMMLAHTDPIYQYAPVRVLAPFSGIVSSIDVTLGSHVVQGQRLASIIDPTQVEIQLEIPAQDIHLMSNGLTGEFYISNQEHFFNAKIRGVSPFVDPGTGTALAALEFLEGADRLPSPGVQGQVAFKVNSHFGFSVPDSAIIYKGKESFVRVVDSGKIKQISVVLGKKQRGFVEVLKGLYPDAHLVERASRFVAEGETVTVESAQQL
jgi:multidrug efflux pump subunit AcrA (membrane-fusion protein)